MNETSASPKPKPTAAPRWEWPDAATRGVLIFLLAVVLLVRLLNPRLELFDNATVSLMTTGAALLAVITLWSWFSFRSSYSRAARRTVLIGGIVVALLIAGLVRLEGITGDFFPTGWRAPWQKPRDYGLAKPGGPQALPKLPLEAIAATPDDYPQFLGPQRDGYLPDVQLSHDWKSDPPRELWRKPVGAGWSAFSVVADRAVTLEQYGDEELVTCRDLNTGDVLWSHAVPARHEEFMGGIGPRSTPTIHESKVYALGATGVLSCLQLSNGELVWQENLRQRFPISQEDDLKAVMWGRSNSPLIHGDLCIVPGGGKDPVALAAFDKETGKLRWESQVLFEGRHAQISYASPAAMTLAGREQIVSVNEGVVSGHDPEDGRALWTWKWPSHSNMDAASSQPQPLGDNRVFLAKGYGLGSAVIQVTDLGGELHASEVWADKRLMQSKFTNAVIVGGHAYGLSDGIFQCIDVEAGKKKWMAGRYGHGQIVGSGDVILVQTENTGELVMLAIDPNKHRELGRIKSLGTHSQAWNNLCLAGKMLLLRNADEAVCLELK